MALDYGKRLKETMSDRKNDIPIFMGGILNQKLIDEALPVDVSEDLKALGFHACKRLEDEPFQRLALNSGSQSNE